MRKLVSLSAILLFLVGVVVVSEPARAIPPCSCVYCEGRPTNRCLNWEDGGILFRCSDYLDLFCSPLTASPTEKTVAAAPKPDFFPMEFFGIPSLAVPSYAGPWVAKKAGC